MKKSRKISSRGLLFSFFIMIIIISFFVLKIKEIANPNRSILEDHPSNLASESIFKPESSLIKKFSSHEELFSFLNISQERLSFIASEGVYDMSFVKNKSMDSASGSTLNPDSGPDFSDTNIQVSGVDEADIIKTDGKYIYALASEQEGSKNNSLYIIEAYPAEELKILSKLEFSDESFFNLFVKGDRLILLGQRSDLLFTKNLDFSSSLSSSRPFVSQSYQPNTLVKVFDLSDKENPVELRDLEIEGYYFDSRLIGDHLYFLVNNYSFLGSDILPKIFYQEKEFSFCDYRDGLNDNCLASDIYYFDTPYYDTTFSSIFSFNIFMDDEKPRVSSYLLPAGQILYVSPNNIYIIYTKYLNEYDLETEVLLEILFDRLSVNDKELINEIKDSSDKVLSSFEKKQKIRIILDRYLFKLSTGDRLEIDKDLRNRIRAKYPHFSDELQKTVIYKLSVFNGLVEPVVKAELSGSVLNQFSLDEYNGYFRIATTRDRLWSRYLEEEEKDSVSSLFIFDHDLQLIGELRDLSPDERIYAVRFLGERAFLVTFKQVDPLIAINLKNPYTPRVVGELEIPGFSNYLHPYGEGLLLGLGREMDLTEEGALIDKGVKLSLFDISEDLPREIDSYKTGLSSSDSVALYDHHAFLASESKNIISFPISWQNNFESSNLEENNFNGFLVFDLIDGRLNLRGKINHQDGFWSYNKRSLYIGNNFYSFSDKMIKINNIKDLVEVNSLEF